jgi:intracellular sulfur oxidation DsrE/DsrF family protein
MSISRILLVVLSFCLLLRPAAAAEPVKVVYHLNEAGLAQALRTINFVSNHLGGDPGAEIVVLAQADGVFFLSADTRTDTGTGFAESVTLLQKKGVRFEVCNLSLLSRGIAPGYLIPGVKIVASGVVELARLQSAEGFAYIRP